MDTRKVDKREQHVRKKLTAAILMLLISCIMTVTSTYAWFTLSTAPEVTGIQTTIGGNGNLEIALANTTTWNDPTQVTTLTATSADITVTNASWGNLIDVSPIGTVDTYGINKLTLSPARLNLTGNTVEKTTILSVPKYGADGRISQLTAAMNAVYNVADSSFTMGSTANFGVRAIGISAAMTSRQSNFMNAKSAVSSALSSARQIASTGLVSSGGTLGNVAVKYATEATPSFTQEDINAVKALLTSTEDAAKKLDDAILSMMDAYVASAASQIKGITDFEYGIIKNVLESLDIWDSTAGQLNTAFTVTDSKVSFNYEMTEEGSSTSTTKPCEITDSNFLSLFNKYTTIRTSISNALAALNREIAKGSSTYTWDQISPSVNAIMSIQSVKVAGMTMDQLKAKKDDGTLVNALMPYVSNLVIELGAGSGVYADIAELAGTIKAGMTMDLVYGGMDLNGLNATILAECTTPLLSAVVSKFEYPTSAGSAEASRISDIYGYALDLLFRTNADNSSLLLQTTPVDRIYSDNNNEDTRGGGSTMTFTKNAASYSDESMLGLMDAIKIVFIDENGTVLGKAGLDTGSKTTYDTVTDGSGTHVLADGTYYEVKYVDNTDTDTVGDYKEVTDGSGTHYKNASGVYVEATANIKVNTTTNYVVNADGSYDVSIRMYNAAGNAFIYENTKSETTTYTYTEATTDATHIKVGETYYEVKYIADSTATTTDGYRVITENEKATHYYNGSEYVAGTATHIATATTVSETVNPVITSLTQNAPERVSVIVYLDGDIVGNDDVANAATSMTATMNLQFASDAGLVPMEYSGLHVQNTNPTPTPEG